jgi:hypothetical protein
MWSSYPMKACSAAGKPKPPAINLIRNDRNQMDSGSHADYWVKKFYISRVWMPTKSEPLQANQRASSPSMLLISAKGFVSFVPCAVRRLWCCGWVRSLLGESNHVLFYSLGKWPLTFTWRHWGRGKKKQNKLIDCKASYDVSMN